MPDKAVDLMGEAAAKMRLDVESLPTEVKELDRPMQQLPDEGEAAAQRGDYQRAAQARVEGLRVQEPYQVEREAFLGKDRFAMVIREQDNAELISEWTGIPASSLIEGEADKLLHMEERLHQRVIGQDDVIHAVSDAIRRSRAGLQDPKRPIGSFMFLGPTRVGKTELARTLAAYLFDDEDSKSVSTCPSTRRSTPSPG